MEKIENVKKRETKEVEKIEEEEKDTKSSQKVTPQGNNAQAKKDKKHIKTEISAVPPTEEEIAQRFKGSYLEKMNFGSYEPLISVVGRIQCPKCKTNRKFFCPAWYVPLVKDIPVVKLPVNFTVLKHPGEKIGKSSIIASKILSPDNVDIHNKLEPPEFDYENTILLFPKDDATPITSFDKSDLSKIKNVVLIDSTWLQVNKFLNNPKISSLKPCVINTEKTIFWRYQRGQTDKNLSTIEAMYFFMRDYDKVMSESEYDGKYDNLLYFYGYNYALIQNEYSKGLKKDRKFKEIKGYIKEKQENTQITE